MPVWDRVRFLLWKGPCSGLYNEVCPTIEEVKEKPHPFLKERGKNSVKGAGESSREQHLKAPSKEDRIFAGVDIMAK